MNNKVMNSSSPVNPSEIPYFMYLEIIAEFYCISYRYAGSYVTFLMFFNSAFNFTFVPEQVDATLKCMITM